MSTLIRWHADNSELRGLKEAQIPDTLLFGGVAVPHELEQPLRKVVEDIKARYAKARAPIKWNFRDLEKLYRQPGWGRFYEPLLESSSSWRSEIFDAVRPYKFAIIVSVLEAHSAARNVIKRKKDALTQYVFANSLMRFGLHVQESRATGAEVIMDWPDKGRSGPFDTEYAAAFNTGKTQDGQVTYDCGPLKDLGFADHAMYAHMHHSTLLQLSDLIVGASREFVECALGKRTAGQGVQCLRAVREKLRGYPDQIFGRGINVATKDDRFKASIKQGIKETLIDA
jgi:hypothetical protein